MILEGEGKQPEAIEDEVAEIKAEHFEESMKYACKSVSDSDICKYWKFS